jgi:hypothetical protein
MSTFIQGIEKTNSQLTKNISQLSKSHSVCVIEYVGELSSRIMGAVPA